MALPAPGDVLGRRLQLVERLGRDPLGLVHRARALEHGPSVRVRTLPRALARRDRRASLHRAVRAAQALDHPHLLVPHGLIRAEGAVHLLLDDVEGEPVAALLGEGPPLAPHHALAVVDQVLAGLEPLHRAGHTLGWLRPERLLVRWAESRPHVTLLGAGLTHLVPAVRLTHDAFLRREGAWVAPELCRIVPEVTPRADVFAVGVLLHTLLVGAAPAAPGRLHPGLPVALRPVLEASLSAVPERRPADATSLRARLVDAAASQPPPALRRTDAAPAVLGGAAVFALAGLLWSTLG